MKRSTHCLFRTLLPVLFVFTLLPTVDAQVTAVKLNAENWEKYAPEGKEVDAIYGDYVLQNSKVRAVIAMPIDSRKANMTVKGVGGCLIDFVTRDFQSDQLSAFYPGKRAYRFQSWRVEADGTKVSLDDSPIVNGKSISIIVSAQGTETTAALDVEYRLDADLPYLKVIRHFKNGTKKPISVRLEDEMRFDGTTSFVHEQGDFLGMKEFMTKSPNGIHYIYTVQDVYWKQAYGFTAIGKQTRKVQSNSTSRTSSIRYVDEKKLNRVSIEPSKTFSFESQITVGKQLIDVNSSIPSQSESKKYTLRLLDQAQQPVEGFVHFRSGSMDLGWVRTNAKGLAFLNTIEKALSYSVVVNGLNVVKSKTIEFDSAKPNLTIRLNNYNPCQLVVRTINENDQPLPCKIEIRGESGTVTPNFAPDSGEYAVRNLRYAPHGVCSQKLAPGKYELVISRGPEYDASFQKITLNPGSIRSLNIKLNRTVNTKGWISSDFHSHSSPSGDNTGSQFGRVLNLVCENVEYGPCTEHNRISTYQTHIDKLKIQKYFASVPGMELTGGPLPLNHHNTFPLIRKPRTQDGGAPLTDTDVAKQIERLALWDNNSEKLLQQNHPDIGNLFYDKNGDGIVDEGFKNAVPFIDAMEIHPISFQAAVPDGDKFEDSSHRVFNWIQLLNQGYRIPGVVNTDAHFNFHGSGGLRIWIKSPTDKPEEIKVLDVVHASEKGNLIMSNGPFLEVYAAEGNQSKWVDVGDDLRANSGNVKLKVKVQCPNWIDIDRVTVLANGRVLKEHDYSREKNSKMFSNGVVKFNRELSISVKKDTHLIVIATNMNTKLGTHIQGPRWGNQSPTAITNPIFVDVDGNGFQPNKDTLGYPLPVKRGKRPKKQEKKQ